MWLLTAAALLVAALVWAQPAQVGCGAAQAGCGPAAVVATASTAVVVPAAGAADVNCPGTVPTQTGTQGGVSGWANFSQTCATGSNPGGYTVTAVTLFVGVATAGAKVKCSVYDTATPQNHVATGCDTVEGTLPTSPAAFVTLATTGACVLAPGTRYSIGCTADTGTTTFGNTTTACASCWSYLSFVYATAWPTTVATTGSYNTALAYYLTATPATGVLTTTTTTTLPGLVVPAAGASDVNCPATIPTQNATQASNNGYANQNQTCATGSNATGYDVTSIALYVGAATAGKHIKCSVYDSAGPPRNHLAAGCDTVEAVLAASPTGFVTMNTTGACHLAAATRYWIACNADDTVTAFGKNTTACAACWAYTSNAYVNAWPATLTPGGSYTTTLAAYLRATPSP